MTHRDDIPPTPPTDSEQQGTAGEHVKYNQSAQAIIKSLDVHTPTQYINMVKRGDNIVYNTPHYETTLTDGFVPEHETQAESVVESILPYYADDSAKTKYMSYRSCGFTVNEALQLTDRRSQTLHRWRKEDAEFNRLDTEAVSELRARIGRQFIYAEFMRNTRLVLQRDFDVLKKAVQTPDDLSVEDHRYLRAIRPQYSTEQLQKVTAYLNGEKDTQNATFNIVQLIQEQSQLDSQRAEQYDARKPAVASPYSSW